MKFYNKAWFMWIMMLFISPIGIFLLWKNKMYHKGVRITLYCIFGLWSFIWIMGLVSAIRMTPAERETYKIEQERKAAIVAEEKQQKALSAKVQAEEKEKAAKEKQQKDLEAKAQTQKVQTKVEPISSPKPEEKKETSTETVKAEEKVPSDLNEFINYIVKKNVGEKSNMDKPKLREVLISGKNVIINLNADDNFTNNMMITGMLSDSNKILKALAARSDIDKIVIAQFMVLQDAYGKEADSQVFTLSISKEKLDKIVWENFTYSNLPKIADSYVLHPVLMK